jgi:hypothetical protein
MGFGTGRSANRLSWVSRLRAWAKPHNLNGTWKAEGRWALPKRALRMGMWLRKMDLSPIPKAKKKNTDRHHLARSEQEGEVGVGTRKCP